MIYTRQKSSIARETFDFIADRIRGGRYAPGDKLPGERSLARQLRVGRNSVREAIRRLETAGLLETRQGLGSFVKDPSGEILQTALISNFLTDTAIQEKLFDLRLIIEVEATVRAVQCITPEQLQDLRRFHELVEKCSARGDIDGMIVADFEFHRQLLVATGNDILVNLMDGIMDLLREMRRVGAEIPELLSERISSHRAIIKAIENGDGEAARRAMKEHLEGVFKRVKSIREDK